MALDVNEIPDQTLSDIMENLETEDENDVGKLSPGEAIDRFLIWNGICGFTGMILDGVEGIRAASTIHEIRTLVNPPTNSTIDIDEMFVNVVDVFDEHGHMGNITLKMVGCALRLATSPTGRSLALLKIREVVG
jgi:hypothetical protein